LLSEEDTDDTNTPTRAGHWAGVDWSWTDQAVCVVKDTGSVGNEDDRFDAYLLADVLRTDRRRLTPLTVDASLLAEAATRIDRSPKAFAAIDAGAVHRAGPIISKCIGEYWRNQIAEGGEDTILWLPDDHFF
jgi:hypothetical protein